ncbi:MAG: hypothetical protein IJK69_01840 [Oscillospiraceae bacterium]|jgi:hypothetical protein|nr:hypothetical protein [Oscillospiraceae bacterium]MBQ2143887.1 hypothetical protein [Oscillospiraceae bacterium]MBQ6280781.1 hypothetical protein [Oscillospiraceae bacterium]MBQ9374494.1 hypothetical protein [Oscillospiraceae bacterium]
MKTGKLLIVLLLIAAMLTVFAACTDPETEENDTAANAETYTHLVPASEGGSEAVEVDTYADSNEDLPAENASETAEDSDEDL